MSDSRSQIIKYFKDSEIISRSVDTNQILRLVEIITEVKKRANTIFIVGNGGSASTASHFATDLGVGSLTRANPVKAISLCDNMSTISAVSNDLEFEAIYEQQLKLLGKSGDLLIVISASGNSKNLVRAIKTATHMDIITFTLTGFDGGRIKEMTLESNINVDTPLGAYGLVEDAHLAICHAITECIRAL